MEALSARAVASDHKDADAVLRAHVPGSRDLHGIFEGTIEEFVEYLRTHNYASMSGYGLQRHVVSNVMVEFMDDATAVVESYHQAYHQVVRDGVAYDITIGGRYLDRFQEHKGRWLIASRSLVFDWSRVEPAATDEMRDILAAVD
jgi:3-phenylpropionate/cinnamic acid dioxygenase small subunit